MKSKPVIAGRGRERSAGKEEVADDSSRRGVLIGVGAATVCVVLATLLAGSWVTTLSVAVLGGMTLVGVWRGGAEIAGLAVGMLAAVMCAPLAGRLIEGVTAGALGTTGLLNRMVAIGVSGLIVVIVVSVAANYGVKRLLERRPELRAWNAWSGLGLGAAEGAVLVLALHWVPAALEPLAMARVFAESEDAYMTQEQPADGLAMGVVKMARASRGTWLGSVAEATNPVAGAELLGIAADFAAITRDEVAMEHFLASKVVRSILELPSVQEATAMLEADAELKGLVSAGGVTVDGIVKMLRSETVLAIIDDTRVVRDLTPQTGALVRAIAEAKLQIQVKGPGG
jgi:hypothetical protein